ncbi:auxin efflux carrier [Microdochium trichocladiopsis]|uniref:Auxin efflux carrier n=1 Tax=Microdochium trichocladiopsis TaxID=1682393 RepID=A0A9P8YDF7_9PEZI|nr:auxin efflux carrier [Microdochium trichocladiopsis]KAH7037204.1 auxin efflux carrier [Microdochium trichocladiopsis]
MAWSFTSPTSFRLNNGSDTWAASMSRAAPVMEIMKSHESHPSIDRLIVLVFSAVMEVVCVSLPGYIIARLGHFDADKQKFIANLNVMLFTPCLVFTKLGSQLNAEKLADLAVIPVIFVVQTLVSYAVSVVVSKLLGLGKRPSNFITAMGVFGNSNSLPISLVLSLSATLKGLHWDRVPGDNDDEVGARGILYLLVFQQLGQLVRWSWGYHVLLAPKSKYPEYQVETTEEGRYRDDPTMDASRETLIPGLDGSSRDEHYGTETSSESDGYEPAGRTPVAGSSRVSLHDPKNKNVSPPRHHLEPNSGPFATPYEQPDDDILSFPRMTDCHEPVEPQHGIKGQWARVKRTCHTKWVSFKQSCSSTSRTAWAKLPAPMRVALSAIGRVSVRFYNFLWEFMNPPLWAMLIAMVVASVPELQRIFFKEGTFVNNSVTSAITQSGGVAVPLILVVLGANLARNTQGRESHDPEEERIGRKLLIASLVCRMLLPTLIMAPIIALFAKYVPVSILDDPIFIIVCFLLTGAPSALQLAQICQINEVYETVMSRILFQSYVIWILPSTLVLVMLAMETLEWAKT